MATGGKYVEFDTGGRWCLRMTNSTEIFIERVVVGVKVKVTVEQAMKAQRGSRGIALLFL